LYSKSADEAYVFVCHFLVGLIIFCISFALLSLLYCDQAGQLDFLLSKASEYSNFISKDLEELQASMAMQAQKKMEKADKRKRKSSGESSSGRGKKTKANSGEELKTAFVKDAQVRAAAKPIFVQPPNLADGCYLKDYQLEGVRWLTSLFENGVSGILADEVRLLQWRFFHFLKQLVEQTSHSCVPLLHHQKQMGLGKTIQVIGLVAHLLTQNVAGPFLVVAPLATLPNWVREFEKWLPTQPVIRYHGTAADREAMMRGPMNPKERRNKSFPVIITSYETAIRDLNKLTKLSDYAYVIVDEGHRLKNHRCMLIQSLKSIKTNNRLLLTGTPIQSECLRLRCGVLYCENAISVWTCSIYFSLLQILSMSSGVSSILSIRKSLTT
jgi:ATP-dependent DNA helicase